MSSRINKKVLYLAACLFTVFIAAFTLLRATPPPDIESVKDRSLSSFEEEVYFELVVKLKKLQKRAKRPQYNTSTVFKRNPFQLPEFKRGAASGVPAATRTSVRPFKLNGVLWDDAAPSAVINNEIVLVGSTLRNYKVKEISRHSVIMQAKNGKTVTLQLQEGKSN